MNNIKAAERIDKINSEIESLVQEKLSKFNLGVFHIDKPSSYHHNKYFEIINKIIEPYKFPEGFYNDDTIDLYEFLNLTVREWFSDKKPKFTFDENKFDVIFSKETLDKMPQIKLATEKFEKENVPNSGKCKTLIGEIFRSIQYMQYRSFNDGDLPWNILSPSFESNIFMMVQIEYLNKQHSLSSEGFKFKDMVYCNHDIRRLSNFIEDYSCLDGNLIKYELIELLNDGQIKDEANEFDSRNFLSRDKI